MTATATQQANLAVARDIADTYRAGRVEALVARYDELYADDLVWSSAIVGGVDGATWHGREGLEAYGRELFESFESMEIDGFRHEAVRDDVVLSLGRLRVLGRDSRVELSSELGFVWRLRDGLIVSGHSLMSHDAAREEAARAA